MKILFSLFAFLICVMGLRCKPDLGFSDDFTVTTAKQLLADNKSQTLVRVEFGQVLHRDEEITITTSNGLLFNLPILATSTGSNSLTVRPSSKFAEFFLRSSDLPDDNVIVSAIWNRYKTYQSIQFTRACPNKLFTTLDQRKIHPGDTLLLIGQLMRDTGQVSRNTQLMLSITDSASTVQLSDLLPLIVDGSEFQYKLPTKINSTGMYRLVIKVFNNECSVLENVEWFSVEE